MEKREAACKSFLLLHYIGRAVIPVTMSLMSLFVVLESVIDNIKQSNDCFVFITEDINAS